MRIAKYWHRETQAVQNPRGSWYRLVSWGSSWTSLEEARDAAIQKIARVKAKVQRNEALSEYEYQIGEIREELIQVVQDDDEQLIGAVTRNRYGALVLNTADVLIADIDVQPAGGVSRLGRLFGRKPADKTHHLNGLRQLAQTYTNWCLRVYETHSGLRVFVTHQPFMPQSAEAQQVLQQLGSDELYQKLCRYQQSFRARLTPKPWRCGMPRPPHRFPRQTSEQQRNFMLWQQAYETQTRAYGVCRLLETLGSGRMTDNARQLIDIHDRYVLHSPATPLA